MIPFPDVFCDWLQGLGKDACQFWQRPLTARFAIGVCALIGPLLATACCWAAPPDDKAITSETRAIPSVEALINRLFNHNQEPLLYGQKGRYWPVFARDYDWCEQERVLSSINQLLRRAEEAWPQLLLHFGEKHYSLTEKFGDGAYNISVGDTCQMIIAETLSASYYDQLPSDLDRRHDLRWPNIGSELKSWCDNRKGKPLYELQIEVCTLAIKEIPSMNEVPEAARTKSDAAIKGQMEMLRESKRPILMQRWPRGPQSTLYSPERAEELRARYEERKQQVRTRDKDAKP